MTPDRVFLLTRRNAVLAFVVMLAVAIGVALWNDYRIDQAEERISSNSARAADLEAANKRQDVLRGDLLRGLLHADEVACLRIEALKTQNRLDAVRTRNQLARNLRLLGVPSTSEIVAVADEELARSLRRNRPKEC